MWNGYWIWLTFERRQFCVDNSPRSELSQSNNYYKCCCDFNDKLFKCGDNIFVNIQNHAFIKPDCKSWFNFDLDFDFELDFYIEFTSRYTRTKFRNGSQSERSCQFGCI